MSYDRDRMKKEQMWRSYWEGYKEAYDVEEMTNVAKRAAKRNFEQWWERNES